eukprot:g18478.t1
MAVAGHTPVRTRGAGYVPELVTPRGSVSRAPPQANGGVLSRQSSAGAGVLRAPSAPPVVRWQSQPSQLRPDTRNVQLGMGEGFEPQLTPRTDRHVRGRKCWVHLWVGTFSILYVAALVMTALQWTDQGLCVRTWWCVSRMYLCTFIAALMWVWYLWRSTTREGEVPLGLLVSIWFTTGTLSVGMCSLCNWGMVQFWAWLDPLCYITYPADNWPWELRPTPSRVLQGLERCRCSLPFVPKGWFMRLADSPLAVALCGVAAGGGLATTENFMYIFSCSGRKGGGKLLLGPPRKAGGVE